MGNILKQVFCNHKNLRKMNIELGKDISLDGKHKKYKSIWICEDCGKMIYSENEDYKK